MEEINPFATCAQCLLEQTASTARLFFSLGFVGGIAAMWAFVRWWHR